MGAPWICRSVASLIVASTAASLVAAPALAELVSLRWMQPIDSAPVEEFRIYKGRVPDQGTRIYTGLPVPDAQGIYSTDVQVEEIDAGIPVYVWITAANRAGESAPSDPYVHPEGCDPLADGDCDGVLDAPDAPPCATGQTTGCADNCPYWANPGKEDRGGIGGAPPDGIGDACQCGDVNGDGRITLRDVKLYRAVLLFPSRRSFRNPDLCDVGGSLDCDIMDYGILLQSQATPLAATVEQQCPPANPVP